MLCELTLNKTVKKSKEEKLTFLCQSTKPHNHINELVVPKCSIPCCLCFEAPYLAIYLARVASLYLTVPFAWYSEAPAS